MHVLDEPRQIITEELTDDPEASQIVVRVRYVLGVSAVALFAATWKLWIPHDEFPQIPLIAAALGLPAVVEWLLAGILLLSLGLTLAARSSSPWWRRGLVALAIALTCLILCDQQRLQTWAYQFALMGPVLALVPARYAVPLLRLFIASIYMHSAVSKLSMTFLNSSGPALIAGLLKATHLSLPLQNSLFERAFEALLPIGELTMAVLLLVRATRWYGLWLSIVMHGLLLLALGPLGLNNRPGVLIWNFYFIVQNIILFGPLIRGVAHGRDVVQSGVKSAGDSKLRISAAARSVILIMAAAMLLPFLEPFGRFDHWPSWAVYAGSAERIRIYIPGEQRAHLPEFLQSRTIPVANSPDVSRVLIDRWALDSLSAPIYPEDRFQIGIALSVARHLESDAAIMVMLESRATRLGDERKTRVLNGRAAIERELETFWWNGYPREL